MIKSGRSLVLYLEDKNDLITIHINLSEEGPLLEDALNKYNVRLSLNRPRDSKLIDAIYLYCLKYKIAISKGSSFLKAAKNDIDSLSGLESLYNKHFLKVNKDSIFHQPFKSPKYNVIKRPDEIKHL